MPSFSRMERSEHELPDLVGETVRRQTSFSMPEQVYVARMYSSMGPDRGTYVSLTLIVSLAPGSSFAFRILPHQLLLDAVSSLPKLKGELVGPAGAIDDSEWHRAHSGKGHCIIDYSRTGKSDKGYSKVQRNPRPRKAG